MDCEHIQANMSGKVYKGNAKLTLLLKSLKINR